MRTTRIAAIAASLVLATGTILAPSGAFADQVIAQDLTVTQPVNRAISVTPNAPNSLQIKAAPKTKITVKAKGVKTRSVTTNAQGSATVTKLVSGRNYTIAAGANRVTATPVVPVTGATGLRVATTETPGNVELTWNHVDSPSQGAVSYRVTATPIVANQVASDETLTSTTTQKSIVLVGLDLSTRYEFAVTPLNALGAGTPTNAIMAKTLGELTNTTVVEQPRVQAPTQPKPQSAPQPAPQPAGPTTRTIYVCPDGFTEAGGLCEKVIAYTYTTIDYTFHSETRTEACSGPDCPGSYYRSYAVSATAPHCPQGGTIHGSECAGWTDGSRTVTYQVKDTTPTGYSDNGTAWTKKDAMPAGYTDNGTAWVLTTAKEARVVPA